MERSKENLVHFWRNFPPMNAEAAVKVDKIGAVIESVCVCVCTVGVFALLMWSQLHERVNNLRSELNEVEKITLGPRLIPLRTLLQKALVTWEEEKSKRKIEQRKKPRVEAPAPQ